MTNRRLLLLACVCWLLWLPVHVYAADLAGARTLYASASYEEALAMLATIETPDTSQQVNQLRALCFLALGRTNEAEQSIERIVLKDPSYAIEQAEVPPKFVTLFTTVRQRTLPTIVRSMYAKAKISFDEKRWADARGEFKNMLALADDSNLGEQRASLTELKQLGEGFLKLSETELASAEAAAARAAPPPAVAPAAESKTSAVQTVPPVSSPPPPASTPTVPEASPEPATAGSGKPAGQAPSVSAEPTNVVPDPAAPTPPNADTAIYSAQNQDVVPPVELQRPMPRWSPINRMVAQATYRGLIEIVIDQRGMVESASMAKSVTAMYDDLLLQTARRWRFAPAKKDGRPVRYRQVLEIVLRPSGEE